MLLGHLENVDLSTADTEHPLPKLITSRGDVIRIYEANMKYKTHKGRKVYFFEFGYHFWYKGNPKMAFDGEYSTYARSYGNALIGLLESVEKTTAKF